MIIFVFGSPDLKIDSLPLRILPKLQEHFPNIKFIVKDPNEEWEEIYCNSNNCDQLYYSHQNPSQPPFEKGRGRRNPSLVKRGGGRFNKCCNQDSNKHLYIIDTVINIKKITVFHDLSVFEKAPRVSMHDFDAYANLLLLKKLGKLPACTIIGVPPDYDEYQAFKETTNVITDVITDVIT